MEQLNMYLFHRNDRVHHVKKNSEIAVSYFQNRRWRLITLLEELSGFWPYQSKIKQHSFQLFYFFIALTASSAVTNKLIEYVGIDISVVRECVVFMFIFLSIVIKLIHAATHQYSRRKFYRRVIEHFGTMNDPEEAAVLSKSAEDGFKHALVYLCIISVVSIIFVSAPIIQSLYDYLFTHKELTVEIPFPMNYGFDHKKYWYIIALDIIAWVFTCLLIEFTYNFSYILQVRHAAALFKIVGIRLRKASEIGEEFESETMSDLAAEKSYSIISSAIDLHLECFEVVDLIEETYTTTWLVIILLSTSGFGAGLHLVVTKLYDPIEMCRYVSGFLIVLLHFQMVFSQGQIIIDSAESVSAACCECKWYALPKKSRKLLPMMMMRTSIPCRLTGGKAFPLSMMESFSKIFKAGLSYYTVIKTTRN